MPCDNSTNSDEYSQVLGTLLELRNRISPDYTVYGEGGEFNVDLGRLQSMQTASFNRFYSTNDLSSVHSVGNQVKYTYVSNINSSIHYYIDIYNSATNVNNINIILLVCINIDFSAVRHSILSKLKVGKHNGFDGVSFDFILNGTELLCHQLYLSTLFSLMLSHCYAPDSFHMSTMIPIPKGSGSMGDI